jgi:hypothetical protein
MVLPSEVSVNHVLAFFTAWGVVVTTCYVILAALWMTGVAEVTFTWSWRLSPGAQFIHALGIAVGAMAALVSWRIAQK